MDKGMLLIISGPSGSGKGTVLDQIRNDENISLSISVTTRKPRGHEVDGVDYFFTSTKDFYHRLENDDLLEHATFVGNLYGTPRQYVESQITLGKTVVLELDVNGALQVKEKFPEAVLVFLLPKTFSILKNRLIRRDTESKETIEERLEWSKEELKLIFEYDYMVTNDDILKAASDLRQIVYVESMKPNRSQKRIGFFTENELAFAAETATTGSTEELLEAMEENIGISDSTDRETI